jgi:hypothetical protein
VGIEIVKIAVMQPYWYPYSGYFRLFAATDLFVILDCVQWNRRGRVHRYEKDGGWVTLPIKKTNRDTTMIMDLEWNDEDETIISPTDYIIKCLSGTCSKLKIPFKAVKSSSLKIQGSIHAQDRIIAICKSVGATEYLNSPGGRDLYNELDFARNDMRLKFLPEYAGSYDSIKERMKKETPMNIRNEIYANI